jgi:hypothetical protein
MGDSLWRTRASEGTRTSEKVETSEREETGEREISSVTKTQDSLRLSLSVLKKEEDTSSGREAYTNPPPSNFHILRENLSSTPTSSPCKSFSRFRAIP